MKELLLFEEGAGGARMGTLSCVRQGMYVRFQASCPCPQGSQAVRKVWLEQGEKRMLLGTLAPEGNALTLQRSVSLAALAEQGISAPERGIVTGEAAPRREPSPQREQPSQWQGLNRFPMPLPEGTIPGGRGGWRRCGDGYLLRFPWGVGRPWPLVSLFCFAQVRDGAVYYRLDGQGVPLMPPPDQAMA